MTRCLQPLRCAVMAFAPPTSAQLLNKEAPVIVGHYHLNVTSVEAHKKFWVDTLGGTAIEVRGGLDVIKFPDVFLFLHVQKPTGPTRRHGVRSHRLRRAGRPGADHEGRRERLSADDRPRTSTRERRSRCRPRATTGASPTSSAPTARRSSSSRTWTAERAADHASPRALHQQAVRRDAAVVHEGVQRDAAAGPRPTSSSAPICPASATCSTSSAGKAIRASPTCRPRVASTITSGSR